MLTTVTLDGVMGKKFGKQWRLQINSPDDALRLINANKPGLFFWIRDNLETYQNYKVTCEYENGVSEDITEQEYQLQGKIKSIRFSPLIVGSGNVGKIIGGVVLVIVGALLAWTGVGAWGASVGVGLIGAGIGSVVGGVVGLLTPQPKMGQDDVSERVDKTSKFFNGATNTTTQGVGVPLIYGDECLVGSHVVSASITVDRIM